MQTIPLFISFVILKLENPSINIASIDNSNPSKGKRVNAAALIPKSESKPIPHETQPGAKIPRKIPVVAKTPVFPETDAIIFVLYVIRLNKIPKRILTKIKLIIELKGIVSANPIKNAEKSFKVPINPDVL